MKTLLLMGLLLMSGTLFAQQPIEMKVWPNGAPNDNGITEEKMEIPILQVIQKKPFSTSIRLKRERNGHRSLSGRRILTSGHGPRREKHGRLVQQPGHYICCAPLPHAQRTQ